MQESVGSEKGKAFAEFHFDAKGKNSPEIATKPAITISREAGARGHTVAAILADYLQQHVPSHDVWTVFDRNIVEEALQEHKLPERIAAYMKEGH